MKYCLVHNAIVVEEQPNGIGGWNYRFEDSETFANGEECVIRNWSRSEIRDHTIKVTQKLTGKHFIQRFF